MKRDDSGGLAIRITIGCSLWPANVKGPGFLMQKMTPPPKKKCNIIMFVTILRLTAPNQISALAAPRPRWEAQCSTDPLAVFKRPVSKAREGKREKMGRVGGKNGGRGPREKCESYGPRSSTLLMLRVQRVKLEGPGLQCKFNITTKRKKGKEKRTETALTIVSTPRLTITRPMWMLINSSQCTSA